MILIEKTQVMGLEPTIRGMRNPMNSWDKSDSVLMDTEMYRNCEECPANNTGYCEDACDTQFYIGPNDLDLMLRLAKAGSVDGKFRRMIAVYVDLTAPLYWWKEFDTYKVGTVANSCSTMHKIHAKAFTREDFSCEHLINEPLITKEGGEVVQYNLQAVGMLDILIEVLNAAREMFLKTGSEIKACHFNKLEKREELVKRQKQYWWQMIQLLPSSYNQKRTVMLNYEVLANIYQHRRNHKLDEWRKVCQWIESLPYSEIITCNAAAKEESNAIMAAVAKLKGEQWSTEDIVALLLGQTKKERLKSFADGGDTRPVHGGIFDVPDLTAGNMPKES